MFLNLVDNMTASHTIANCMYTKTSAIGTELWAGRCERTRCVISPKTLYSTVIAPFWFSMGHCWIVIMPFWLSTQLMIHTCTIPTCTCMPHLIELCIQIKFHNVALSSPYKIHQLSPRSDGSPVCRGQFGEVLIFYDRPSTWSSNAPACRGQSRLSGFCCAHRLCVRSPCQHISRMRTFDENSCAISITSPKVDFRPRNPTCLVGTRGQVPASVHTMWLPGKVPLGGTFPAKRGPVWTGGLLLCPWTW